ncbi:hypothetical protein CFC21_044197 [Triticum aestivum]|uniref:BI1-like protein n=2 Tax=Triticum aestivum TaxID=4565 RepID=A0A9R1JXB2_WHEAT|nr:protein LIFEGUARD 2-like [Triticum aestivum]KAF7033071.1 hypothetical protein CFC21_044197 [Triticum aestivum]CDM85337.1 unnamed protein product [Triticum aestivum]
MKGGDVEAGGTSTAALKAALYPATTESPELRWELIRKTYVVLFLQLLLTAVVAAVVYKFRHFIESSYDGLGLYIFLFLFFFPITAMLLLLIYRKKNPVNLLLLGVFTVAITFSAGFMCSFYSGKVIWEAGIFTIVVVLSLTAYTFWAARRGKDFSFLGPFLFASLMILLVFGFIQIFFPLDKLSHTIYGALVALIFSGFIVYDSGNIIKRCTYDEYVLAAVILYLDIMIPTGPKTFHWVDDSQARHPGPGLS